MKSFVGQRIELASFHIGFKLKVPGLGVKRRIPPAKRRKLCGGEFLDLLFNGFNLAHRSPCRQVYQPQKQLSATSNKDSAHRETGLTSFLFRPTSR